jgi:hypothetical protein
MVPSAAAARCDATGTTASRRPLSIPVVTAPAPPRRVMMDFSYRIVPR